MNWRRRSLALLFALSAEAIASDVEPSGTVSVIGTRLPVAAAPGSYDVFDAETMETRGSSNVADLLRDVAGVDVARPGGAGAAELFLRGADSNFAAVLVDGVRVNDPTNSRGGSYDFAALDVGQVERIEIMRGPMSAVYGADALSGAINIVTRAAGESPAVAFGGESGTRDYSRVYGRASAPLADRWSGSLFAAHSNAPEDVEGYAARLDALQGGVDYAHADRSGKLRVRYGDTQQTGFPDASGGPLYAVSRELQRSAGKEWSASVDVRQRMSSRWIAELSGSAFERTEDKITPAIRAGPEAVTPQADAASSFRAQRATLNNQIAFDRLYLAAGGELRREAGRQSGLLRFDSFEMPAAFDLERTTYAGFSEGRYVTPWGVDIFAGARWDRPDHFDARASTRLAVSYTHAESGMRAHAGWTDGFKLPSFYALGDVLVGNPALREEEGEAAELGVELPFDDRRIALGLTGYVARYRNLVGFDFATFRLVNLSRATIRGVEAKLAVVPHESLRFDAHTSYMEVDAGDTDTALPLRPKWRGGVAAVWRPDAQWTLRAGAIAVGARRAVSIPTSEITLSRYTRADLAATREIRETCRLRFAVENALNERYQEDAGVPSPGVLVRVGVEMDLWR